MEYKKYIKQVGKYHYLASSGNKTIILSSSDSKTEAREKALDKLGPHIDKFINKTIYFVKVEYVKEADWDKDQNRSLKLLGGRIYFFVGEAKVMSENRIKNMDGGDRIFLSDNYLKKNKGINLSDLIKKINEIHNKIIQVGLVDLIIL